ncbi:uncharacterized protein LOC128962799 [Oppia nitens]|uniref:uncharacterized protein LOC128962799 n=1 Tax=Oppia nitens TaxID=1686743 RepID=UPI0023DC1AB8|nr:uncharacterized protein LOC128962799 [Oppia nitens]
MIRQLGLPTLFFTLSAAEVSWDELIVILSKVLNNVIISNDEAKDLQRNEKLDLIRRDPVTTSRYFENRFREFFKDIILSGVALKGRRVTDYYYRVEFQHQGSPHIHGLLWISDAPKLEKNNSNFFCEVEKFIDEISSTSTVDYIESKSEETQIIDEDTTHLINTLQVHRHMENCMKGKNTCRYRFPMPPMPETRILKSLDDNVLLTEKTLHKINYKLISSKIEELSVPIAKGELNHMTFYDFLKSLNISYKDYINALRSSLKREEIFLKRQPNAIFVNAYNSLWVKLWRANHDIQYCLHPYACVTYLCAYISKSMRGISLLLKQANDEAKKGNKTLQQQVRHLANTLVNGTEISAQEAVYHCLSMTISRMSRVCTFINNGPPNERYQMLKSKKDLENLPNDSTDITFKGILEQYSARPNTPTLNKLCLAEFAASYTYHKSLSDRQLMNINNDEDENEESLINDTTDPKNYYRSLIFLYFPWNNEEKDIQVDLCQKIYERNKEIIDSNRELFDPQSLENQLLDAQLENENELKDETINYVNETIESQHEILAQRSPIYNIFDEDDVIKLDKSKSYMERISVPKVIGEEDYRKMMRSLNIQQRNYTMNIIYQFKTLNLPLYNILMGSAGVGKSHVLKCIYQSVLRLINSQPGTRQETIKVLVTAYTGKAAWNVDGVTLHGALGFPHIQSRGGSLNKLSADIANTMRIDERLKEIFQNNLPFGGISVLLIGDLHQAKPVAAYELTQVMRQKDDLKFVNCLNRLAKAQLDTCDLDILETRVNVIDGTKDEAVSIEDKPGNLLKHMATDIIVKSNKDDEKKILDKISTMTYQETYDGLFNGAVGVLRKIEHDRITKKINRIWIQFSGNSGSEMRRKHQQLIIKQNISKLWTPIDEVKKTFQIGGFLNISVSRTQFPIVCCEAMTIHKSQGSTFHKVLVNLTPGLPRELIYTAFSRVTSINGLYIEGDFSILKNLKPKVSDNQIFEEIVRLQSEAKLDLIIEPQTNFPKKDCLIAYLNVQSLRKNHLDLNCDQNIISSDVLVLVENRVKRKDLPNIGDLKVVSHIYSENSTTAEGGVAIYVKENIKASIIYETIDKHINPNWHYEITCVKIDNIAVVALYISSNVPIKILKELLSIIAKNTCDYEHLIICGDFNIECNSDNGRRLTEYTMKTFKWLSLIPKNVPTTKYGSHIDYIFTTNQNDKIHIYDFYGSDHIPFWIDVSNDSCIADLNSLSTLSSWNSIDKENDLNSELNSSSQRSLIADTLKDIKLDNIKKTKLVIPKLSQEQIDMHLTIKDSKVSLIKLSQTQIEEHSQSQVFINQNIWLSKATHTYLFENLELREKRILEGLEDNGWLNDTHITNGMYIARSLLSNSNALEFEPSYLFHHSYNYLKPRNYFSYFGQNMHHIINPGGHWIYIHVEYESDIITCNVYDSLNSLSTNNFIIRVVSAYIRKIVITPIIYYRIWKVTKQPNAKDCGLHTLINMAYNCSNINPSSRKILDSSDVLRNCLRQWYETGNPSLPNSEEIEETILLSKVVKSLHCTCAQTEDNNMIQCTNCGEKYHQKCLDVTITAISENLICNNCQNIDVDFIDISN